MHVRRNCLAPLVCVLALLTGCDRQATSPSSPSPNENGAQTVGTTGADGKSTPQSATTLHMHIDGVEWIADNSLFGAVHPNGYDRAVMISGSKGPKDANEQAFNINLYGIDGPGTYFVKSGNANDHVAQISNLSPERYLAGGPMGFDLKVEVARMAATPALIEARFEGTLTASDGVTLSISKGEFRYTE